ncbi:MAG: hypothetical protein ACI854_002342 [Arenicella sp.]|jgi:hypothetical protein
MISYLVHTLANNSDFDGSAELFLLQVIKILSTALVLDLIFQNKRVYIKNKAKLSV